MADYNCSTVLLLQNMSYCESIKSSLKSLLTHCSHAKHAFINGYLKTLVHLYISHIPYICIIDTKLCINLQKRQTWGTKARYVASYRQRIRHVSSKAPNEVQKVINTKYLVTIP